MSTVADFYPFVIGVDTHTRTHTYAVLAANGAHLGTDAFPNTRADRTPAIAWSSRQTGGGLESLWIIEGTGTYGALLAGTVARTGYRVVEAPRGSAYASARRGGGPMFLSSSFGCFLFVEGAVFEHGVEDVAATSGQAHDGGVVFFAFAAFALVVGAGERVVAAGYPGVGRKRAFFKALLPDREGCSPWMEVPDWRGVGAMPA